MLSMLAWVAVVSGLASVGDKPANVLTQARDVLAFNAIDVRIPADVVLSPAIKPSLTLEGDPDVMSLVTTEVKNGTLLVTPRSASNLLGVPRLRILVGTAALAAILVDSGAAVAGTINAAPLLNLQVDGASQVSLGIRKSSVLTVQAAGGSKVNLTGTAEGLGVGANGKSVVDAANLSADLVTVNADGKGQVHVHAVKSVEANMGGGAVLRIKGTPPSRQISLTGGARIEESR